MRSFSCAFRSLALTLAVCVTSVGLPTFAGSSSAALSGRILRTGSGAPLRDAVLKVALRPQAKVFESTKTDAKGSFSLPDLPSGTYEVAVQADGGLYVVNGSLSLQPGERRDMMLSVQADPQTSQNGRADRASKPGDAAAEEEPKPEEPKPEEPKPEEPKPAEPKPEAPKEQPKEQTKSKKFYRTAWFGAAAVVGSAVIVGALANSSDKDDTATGSPSSD